MESNISIYDIEETLTSNPNLARELSFEGFRAEDLLEIFTIGLHETVTLALCECEECECEDGVFVHIGKDVTRDTEECPHCGCDIEQADEEISEAAACYFINGEASDLVNKAHDLCVKRG